MPQEQTQIPRVQAADGLDAALLALDTAGAVIIEGAVDQLAAQAAAFELEPYLRRTPVGEGAFYGTATRRCGALVKKSDTLAQWAVHVHVLNIMNRVLGGNCERFQLNATQGIRIEPGEGAQFLHRDEELFPVVPNLSPRIELMVNAIWALTPFTAENGATRIVPGSHKWPLDREPQVGETVPACMAPGDVVLFLGSVLHGGGANRSDAPRTGAVFSYSLGWLRQTENCVLSVPWEDACQLPIRLQELLGYQVHRPSLGWVEGVDPKDWFEAGRPDVGGAKDMLNEAQLRMVAEVVAAPDEFAGYVT